MNPTIPFATVSIIVLQECGTLLDGGTNFLCLNESYFHTHQFIQWSFMWGSVSQHSGQTVFHHRIKVITNDDWKSPFLLRRQMSRLHIGERWLVWVYHFLPHLCRPVPSFSASLNCQMSIHLCNERLTHCNPNAISLSLSFSSKHLSDHVLHWYKMSHGHPFLSRVSIYTDSKGTAQCYATLTFFRSCVLFMANMGRRND